MSRAEKSSLKNIVNIVFQKPKVISLGNASPEAKKKNMHNEKHKSFKSTVRRNSGNYVIWINWIILNFEYFRESDSLF